MFAELEIKKQTRMSEVSFRRVNLADYGFIKRARILEGETGVSLFETISQMEEETTIEKQLIILSSVSSNIRTACIQNQRKIVQYYVELLCHIFLSTESKSPLKQSASCLLMKFPEEYVSDITVCLSQGLINLMKNEDNASLNQSLNKICDCFENFSIGIGAVSLCLNDTLSFICNCLHHVLDNISINLTPVQQMDFIIRGHSALRAAVMVLQKFLFRFKKVADSNSLHEDKILEDMLHVSTELINHELVPMDSKGNCGIVIVIICICIHEDGYNVVLNKLASKNPQLPSLNPVFGTYFESNIAQMSICSGLITVVPVEILCSFNNSQNKYFLEAVFMKLMNLSESTESALSLGCSRALQQTIHIIHNAILNKHCPDCMLMLSNTQILSLSLDFVWSRLDHYMDCVRHAAKTMLHDLVQVGNILRDKEANNSSFLELIINAIKKIPSYKKSKYIALAVLANKLGCQELMKVFPNLVSTLLVVIEDTSMSAHVSNAFESLMLKNYREEECESRWINTWINPVFQIYPKSNVCYVLEGIISKAMKICPTLLDYTVSLFEGDFILSSQLKVFIVCLKIGIKLGVLDRRCKENNFCEEVDKWKGIIKYDVVIQALVNQDNEIRVSALSLIVESNKTTQCLKLLELELMKCFLWYNVNSDSSSLKQKNLMLLKKLLTRIRESAYPIMKSMNHCKETGSKVTDTNETLNGYREFLKWFKYFCFKCFFPGANYSRRASALELLTMLDEMSLLMEKTMPFDARQSLFGINWQEKHAEPLFHCLKDSFESNKILALNILMKFPAEILEFNNASRVNTLLNVGMKLASSVKPPDCITGAYLLKLLVSYPEAEVFLVENCSKITTEFFPDFSLIAKNTTFYKKGTFCVVWILFAQLKRELDVAKYNLLLAAGSGPMYGTLYCIRHLLKNLDFNCIADNFFWKRVILDLITFCFELNSAVIHVVNSSSPEGHLPMDFEPAIVHDVLMSSTKPLKSNEEKDKSLFQKPQATAQMVLLCSWRTVKEVSLFIGEVTNQATILGENPSCGGECYLLTEDIVVSIGDHFTKLLSETKHRGAFEQAYVGFCQLCKKLWRHPSGILSQLPRLWLKDITNEVIRGKKASKLCATRRSAGVPFIVQALVTTELDVNQPTCLKEAMEVLLNLLEEKAPEIEGWNDNIKTESHTHAMNILRALFRHTLLGELVTPYVSRGIMAAINGFKGDTWAERNSATLLFGALIIRVFGVKHSRDDVIRRNRMTGRVFFERFPALYDFLLGELREASTAASKNSDSFSTLHLFPSLFPVLLILSRLYPSSLEGTDSNMQLSAFIPFVQCCLKSKIYKTRELAARAMVPLITANIYIAHLDEGFNLAAFGSVGQNVIHGTLLQISFLLQEVPYPRQENEQMICEKIANWVNLSKKILTDHKEFSYMVKEAYIRVIWHLLFISSGSILSPLPKELWDDVFEIVKSEIRLHLTSPNAFNRDHIYLGGQTYIIRATQILMEIAVVAGYTSQYLVELLSSFLTEQFPVECVNVVLSFICYVFGDMENECMEEEEGLPLFAWPKNGPWQTEIAGYRSCFVGTKSLALAAVNVLFLVSNSYVLQRALKVIGHLGSSALSITWQRQIGSNDELFEVVNPFSHLINLCNIEPENVGRAALFCLTSLVQEAVESGSQEFLSQEIGSEYCNLLMEFSSAEKNELSRMIVAESLVINHFLLKQQVNFLTTWDQCRLWVVLLDLLEDHDIAVREAACKISSSFMFMEGALKHNCITSFNNLSSKSCGNKNRKRESNQLDDDWSVPEVPISFKLFDVMPQRLEELVLIYFEEIFGSSHKYECAVTLLSVTLRDSTWEEGEYDINEERVFDKGEANLFSEHLNLTKKCMKHLKNLFLDPSLLEARSAIPSSMMILTGLEECSATSIAGFLKHSMERMLWKLEMYGKVCGGQFNAFLTQGYDAMEQDVFKVGLTLSVLKKFSTEICDLYETFSKTIEHYGILSSFLAFCD